MKLLTEYLINYVKKTFEYGNDIGAALKDLKEPGSGLWKPNAQVSAATDDRSKAAENRQHEIEFKADHDACRARVLAFENNKTKACALLWERRSKGMKNKVESRADFDSKIKNDPLELLTSNQGACTELPRAPL